MASVVITNDGGARLEAIVGGGAEAVLVGVGGIDFVGRGSKPETIPGVIDSVTFLVGVEGTPVNVILVDEGDLGSPGNFSART